MVYWKLMVCPTKGAFYHKIVIPTGAQRSGGTCCFTVLTQTLKPHPSFIDLFRSLPEPAASSFHLGGYLSVTVTKHPSSCWARTYTTLLVARCTSAALLDSV
jgi:hypothetical protein